MNKFFDSLEQRRAVKRGTKFKMTTFELQRLRDLPIEGVAERLGLRVERHKCLCPFHDDHTPSLTFKGNKFRCWSCGESGDTISLVMKYQNVGFKEATRWLSPLPALPSVACAPQSLCSQQAIAPLGECLGGSRKDGSGNEALPQRGRWRGLSFYERFFEHPFLNAEARHFLFEERHLDERVVRWCRLTSWRDKQGVAWLQIPYYDREGKLIGIQNRNLVKGALPRFRFPQGAECTIYNLPILSLLSPGEPLYITEGCSDCWAMLSAGHKAIAIPSATLLKQKDVELLSALSAAFHMYPDRDEPGERLFLQLQKVLPSLVHHQLPPGCKDFSDYYVKLIVNSG